MIRQLIKTVRMNTLISFGITRPRRHPSIPTQASILKPFSINCLHDNPGSTRQSKRLGRGPGSGKGKFAARGMKGDKARSGGGVPVRFEGGQNPLTRRLRKYGRVKRKYAREILDIINLREIIYFVKKGILNPSEPLTIKKLNDVGLVKKVRFGVKVLGKGIENLDFPIHLEVTDASAEVIKKVKQNGGSVKLIYRTKLKLKEHINPEKFPLELKEPLPPAYRVKKLDRIEKKRDHPVEYRKPQWKIEQQNQQKSLLAAGNQADKFIYPVPREPQPEKIHKRKARLYRRVSYKL